jgi:hypothetical protein
MVEILGSRARGVKILDKKSNIPPISLPQTFPSIDQRDYSWAAKFSPYPFCVFLLFTIHIFYEGYKTVLYSV